jgi:hypothetical protein
MYKALSIDTDKVLEELQYRRKVAALNHDKILAEENARYKQECEDLESFEKLFYCSTYEKK